MSVHLNTTIENKQNVHKRKRIDWIHQKSAEVPIKGTKRKFKDWDKIFINYKYLTKYSYLEYIKNFQNQQ